MNGASLCILNDLAAAIHSACIKDLNDIHYLGNKYIKNRNGKSTLSGYDMVQTPMMRRPEIADIERIDVFQMLFGHGSGLFGGIGAANCPTYNIIIVFGRGFSDACVYQSGRLVYHIDRPNKQFYEDIKNQNMAKKDSAKSRYETP